MASDVDSLPDYVYDTLPYDKDVFRVVCIQPSRTKSINGIEDHDQPIECEIKTIPLENNHSCLSYCWGSGAQPKFIAVNGQRLRIRGNLYRFLLDARARGIDDWLFIDALSIDQKSTGERNHQVQRMSLIYYQAWKVYVWLDPTPTALSMHLEDRFAGTIVRADKESQKTVAEEELFFQLITNEYFDRAWVISEVWLARQIRFLFARRSWSHEEIRNIILKFKPESHEFSLATRRMDGIANLLVPSDPKRYLSTLEQTLRGLRNLSCECEDDRDRIYSLLAIAKDMSGFKVDYSESIFNLFDRVLYFVNGPHGTKSTKRIDQDLLASHMRVDSSIKSRYIHRFPQFSNLFMGRDRVTVFRRSLELPSWPEPFDMAIVNIYDWGGRWNSATGNHPKNEEDQFCTSCRDLLLNDDIGVINPTHLSIHPQIPPNGNTNSLWRQDMLSSVHMISSHVDSWLQDVIDRESVRTLPGRIWLLHVMSVPRWVVSADVGKTRSYLLLNCDERHFCLQRYWEVDLANLHDEDTEPSS